MAQAVFESPVGPLFVDASARGLRLLSFLDGYKHDGLARRLPDLDPREEDGAEAIIAATRRQIDDYFDGNRREFDLPFDFTGTPFQKQVWQQIYGVPFGETISYDELARRSDAPKASRAAGAACGANPIVIVIPCHRIVGSDRGLHGFGGGLGTKAWLLRHEGALAALKSRQIALLEEPASTSSLI